MKQDWKCFSDLWTRNWNVCFSKILINLFESSNIWSRPKTQKSVEALRWEGQRRRRWRWLTSLFNFVVDVKVKSKLSDSSICTRSEKKYYWPAQLFSYIYSNTILVTLGDFNEQSVVGKRLKNPSNIIGVRDCQNDLQYLGQLNEHKSKHQNLQTSIFTVFKKKKKKNSELKTLS